jgi:hypothetical protein
LQVRRKGYGYHVADETEPAAHDADSGGDDAVERLRDHLGEVDDRSDEMQQRLDELGEHIEEARRQAEADDLLPGDEGPEGGDAASGEVGIPVGDEERETPLDDADFEAGG